MGNYLTDEELTTKTPNKHWNSSASNENLVQMKGWLETFVQVCKINPAVSGLSEDELQEIEKDLDISLPSTLRLLYSFVGKDVNILVPEFMKKMDFKLLQPKELKVEKNQVIHDAYSGDAWYETDILIYSTTFKGKKPYNGIDIKKDWDLTFYKQWYWQKDQSPLYKKLLTFLVNIAISHMQTVFTTNVKRMDSLHEDRAAEELFKGYLTRFSGFEHYSHTLFYNEEHQALGWFRANCSKCDLLFGCNDNTFVKELIKKFQFNKAKFVKEK